MSSNPTSRTNIYGMKLIFKNSGLNYSLYKSSYITKNYDDIVRDCYSTHAKFKKMFSGDSTWSFSCYNIFNLSSTSLHFYNIYKDLIAVIKDFRIIQEPLWVQSWINFHKSNEVLDWHDHYWCYHGYICIDPKESETQFEQYSIKNEVGLIYIGPCERKHKVNILKNYDGERITLGFDVTRLINLHRDLFNSFIPII